MPILYTENETNNERIFAAENTSPYVKDGINDYVVNGRTDLVNPDKHGTKASPLDAVEDGVYCSV